MTDTEKELRCVMADLKAEYAAETKRLREALARANDIGESMERAMYLTRDDAERYAYAKTLEGQVVVMETLKNLGSAALDQALDDAMYEEGGPQSAVAAAYGGIVQTTQG